MKLIVHKVAGQAKIIAKRGSSDYLISTGGDLCKVVMLEDNLISKAINIHSILARGYWDEYSGSTKETERVMDMLHDNKV